MLDDARGASREGEGRDRRGSFGSDIRHKFAKQCQEISKTEDVTNKNGAGNLNDNQLRSN